MGGGGGGRNKWLVLLTKLIILPFVCGLYSKQWSYVIGESIVTTKREKQEQVNRVKAVVDSVGVKIAGLENEILF